MNDVALEFVNDNWGSGNAEVDHDVQAPEEDAEPAASLLSLYFKEVAALPVLKPQEEFEMSCNIERLELRLWAQIVGYAPLQWQIINLIKERLSPQVFARSGVKETCDQLVATYQESASLSSGQSQSRGRKAVKAKTDRLRWQACERLAEQVRAIDGDHVLLGTVLHYVYQRAVLHRKEGLQETATDLGPHAQSFGDFYSTVKALNLAAQRVRNEFIKANLRLVMTIARRLNVGYLPFQDLVQEGNIGLIKAVGRFDYRRGFRFSTYASWWIRHTITRALGDKGRMIRVPIHKLSSLHKVARINRTLSNKLGRPPTKEEIGISANMSSEMVESLWNNMPNFPISLDREVAEKDSRRFINWVEDPNSMIPTERVINHQIFEHVKQIFKELSPIERDVLQRRFGLNNRDEYTLEEIGNRHSLSRERIRQIQEQALGKIYKALLRRNAV